MPKIIGEKKTHVHAHDYLMTGYHSIDRAFNADCLPIGIPFGTLWEFYGVSHVAKSTTAYSFASMLAAHLETGWAICDVEDGFTPEYVLDIGTAQGMTEDSVIAIAQGKYHDDKLQALFDHMMDEELNVGVGVLDSFGMIASKAEIEGSLGEANMGKRAFLLNQWVRKYFAYKNDLEYIPPHATVFAINHVQPSFTGYGANRPGGTGKDYGAGVRVLLSKEKVFSDGSFYIRGTVKKLRWMGGGEGNVFRYVSKVGHGMHRGLSAIMDARKLKLVSVNRGNMKVKETGESLGKFSTYLKDYQNDEIFQPFYELLDNAEEPVKEEDDA